MIVHSWPFLPFQARSPAENQRWWDECYVSTTASRILLGQSQWSIISGGPRTGKSIALAALERHSQDTLVLHYSLRDWPNSPHAPQKSGNHLAQIMALAALRLREETAKYPQRLAALRPLHREFLGWLVRTFASPRAFRLWLDALPPEEAAYFETLSSARIYETFSEPDDIRGQIQELIAVAKRMEYSRVLVLLDLPSFLEGKQVAALSQLYGANDLPEPRVWMQQSGFDLVAALPRPVLDEGGILRATRSLVTVIPVEWTRAEVYEVANRLVQSSTDARSLNELATAGLLEELEILVESEFGEPTPGAWVDLARLLLARATQNGAPLDESQFPTLKNSYYAECMPLRLDPSARQRGVWRGPRFLHLEEQPFKVLQVLINKKGTPANSDDRMLIAVTGSKKNIHTQIHRLREIIEPDPGNPVYVKNRRNEGYWIEPGSPSIDVPRI